MDMVGEPVEHELVTGTNAHHDRVLGQHPEVTAPENELGELVRLAVHEELVVGEPEASQDGGPFLVVPLCRVRELAKLRVAGDVEPAALKLV